MTNEDPARTFSLVVEAVKQAGTRAVLVGGWGGLGAGAALPSSILAIDEAPHDWLFPRCAVVVHHGGAGTTAAGLRAGIPTVVVPHNFDQPFWGQRVFSLGVGPQPVPFQTLNANALAAALQQALGDAAMQQRAQALGETIRAEDGVGAAVRLIEDWAQRKTNERGVHVAAARG